MPADPHSLSVCVGNFFEGKTVFITGASGFVGKVLLWIILARLKCRKVVLLLRNRYNKTGEIKSHAKDRLEKDIFGSKIFRSIPPEARTIVDVIEGDIEVENPLLGLSADDRNYIIEDVQVIIHAAASVRFQAPLKDNLNTNTLGSLRIFNLANSCKKLSAYVHVSTAYVNSDQSTGLTIYERSYPLLSDPEELLHLLQVASETDKPSKDMVSALHRLQGSHFNTYTFTKHLSENLLIERNKKLPMAIVRPTIVGCAWKDPKLGWVDAALGAGALFAAGATGLLKRIPGRLTAIGDQIPVDKVCNSILVSATIVGTGAVPSVYEAVRPLSAKGAPTSWISGKKCKAAQKDILIVHCASSTVNPLSWSRTISVVSSYFLSNPLRSVANPNSYFGFVESNLLFTILHYLETIIPAFVLTLLLKVAVMVPFWGHRSKHRLRTAEFYLKMAKKGHTIGQAFAPFSTMEWFFDMSHNKAMLSLLNGQEKNLFSTSPSDVVWDDWLTAYAEGLRVEVLKDPIDDPRTTGLGPNVVESIRKVTSTKTVELISAPLLDLEKCQKLVYRSSVRELNSKSAHDFLTWTSTKFKPALVIPSAVAVHRCLKSLFAQVTVERNTLDQLRRLSESFPPLPDSAAIDVLPEKYLPKYRTKHPVLLIPTHKSYFDFLVIAFICMSFGLRMPMVAADRVFASLPIVSTILRATGAFFLQRGGQNTAEQRAVLKVYFTHALMYHCMVQFFIEGARSRTGHVLRPKRGLLAHALSLLKEDMVESVRIMPIGLAYGELMEMASLSDELVGNEKVAESVTRIIKGLWDVTNQRLITGIPDKQLHPSEDPAPSRISVKSTPIIEIKKEDLKDESAIAWKIVYALQDTRQLNFKNLLAWALLLDRHREISTRSIEVRIRAIIEYINERFDTEKFSRIFGVNVDLMAEQIDGHMRLISPFNEVYGAESLVARGSQDCELIVKNIAEQRWELRRSRYPVITFNKLMNRLHFLRNAALDLLGSDAFIAEAFLSGNGNLENAIQLASCFSETVFGRRMVETEIGKIAHEFVFKKWQSGEECDDLVLDLVGSLVRCHIGGAKFITALMMKDVKGGGICSSNMENVPSASTVDSDTSSAYATNWTAQGIVQSAMVEAARMEWSLGAFPLINHEIMRSILTKCSDVNVYGTTTPLRVDCDRLCQYYEELLVFYQEK